jgi:hypothetical protein
MVSRYVGIDNVSLDLLVRSLLALGVSDKGLIRLFSLLILVFREKRFLQLLNLPPGRFERMWPIRLRVTPNEPARR